MDKSMKSNYFKYKKGYGVKEFINIVGISVNL